VKLNSREQKIVFAGIAMAVVIAIACAAWFLLPNGAEIAKTVKKREEDISKQRGILGRKKIYEEQIGQYKARLDQDTAKLFPGDKPNETNAEIQTRLKEFADRSGVEIIQKNTLQDKKIQDPLTKQDMLTKVSVHIEINCDPERLAKFLVEIQSYSPFLKVEELTVYGYRGIQQRRSTDSRGGDRGGMPTDISSLLGQIGRSSGAGSADRSGTPTVTTEIRASMTVIGYINLKPIEKPAGSAVAAVR
jgi:hypothetical protein